MSEKKQVYVAVDKKDKLFYYSDGKYIPVLDEKGGGGDVELKTINGESLKGSGNIEVLTEHQPLKTINGEDIVGQGDIVIEGGEGLDASKYIDLEWPTNKFALYGYENHPITSIDKLAEIISSWPEDKSIFVLIHEGTRELMEVASVNASTGDRGQLYFNILLSRGNVLVTKGTAEEEWTTVDWTLYKPSPEVCYFQDKNLILKENKLSLPLWYRNICDSDGYLVNPLQVVWPYDDGTITNGWLGCNDSKMRLSFNDGSSYEGTITLGEEGDEDQIYLTELSMIRATADFDLDNFLTPEELNAFAAAWTSNTNTVLKVSHSMDLEDLAFLRAANRVQLSALNGEMSMLVYKSSSWGHDGTSPLLMTSAIIWHDVSLIYQDSTLILTMVVQKFDIPQSEEPEEPEDPGNR